MNNEAPTKENATLKSKIMTTLGYALCFLIGVIIVLSVKSCMRGMSMPEDFKDAKKLLEKEDFSCKYLDEEDEIEDLFKELDVDSKGVTEVLIAFDEDSEDLFLIAHCDDVEMAKDLENELAWELAADDYLYYRGYTIKVNYRMVYFGHNDLIDVLLD
jgi:hypothetical protein